MATQTTKTPTGIDSINSTLNLGSQGEQVKALQQYLSGMGVVGADGKPLKVDGIYGPNTKTAVMQFQQQHGLTQDGIFGPQSLSQAQNITSTSSQYNNNPPTNTGTTSPATSKTGDPALDSTLKAIQDYVTTQQNNGLTINPALNFDQATLDKFLTTATNEVHPYYASKINGIKADVLQALPGLTSDYNNKVAESGQNFTTDLNSNRETNAGNGTAFSGARNLGENNSLATENRNLQDLSTSYGNNLYNLGSAAEKQIGSSNTPSLGSLGTYSASLSGNGGINQTGSTTPYTPGQYQIGSITNDEQAAIEARNQALKNTASANVVAGRSYQNLFA